MDANIKVFRAHRALAWFYAFIGLAACAAILIGSKGQHGLVLLPLFITIAIVFSIHFFTARACRAGKPGGRIASIVISLFMLLGFPIGTLIGIYLLANTWRPWPAKA